MQWLLVGLDRSLKSSHKETLKRTLLCEDESDLTSPTSNHIPVIYVAVSAVNDSIIFFQACMFILFNLSF